MSIRTHPIIAWPVGKIKQIWAWTNEILQKPRIRRLLTIFVVVLSFAFMGYFVFRNWQQLEQYRQHLQAYYPLLFLAFLLYPTGLVPNAVGWHNIMRRLDGLRSFRLNARIYCYSCLPRRIPGSVWHIAGRAYLNREQGVPHSLTLLGTLLEWILLVVSGLLVFLLSHLSPQARSMDAQGFRPSVALLLLVPLVVLLLPPVFNRLLGYLLRKADYEGQIALSAPDLLVLITIYVVAWIAGGIVLYTLILALYPLSPAQLPAVIGAWAGAGAVGLVAAYLLQGLGINEVTLAILLSGMMPLPIAAVAAILMRILLTISEVAWPLLWARFLR